MSLFPGGRQPPSGQSPLPRPGGRPILGRDVALTLAVLLAGYIMATIVVGLLFGIRPTTDASAYRIRLMGSMAASFFALFGAVYVVMIRIKGYSWEDLGFRPLAAPQWRRTAVLMGLLCVPVVIAIASTIQRETGAGPQELTRALANSGFSGVTTLTFFLYVALLLPIAEELIFRGVLFGWLRQSQSFPIANGLCAAAFAIVHIQLVAIVVTFLVGLALGWLRERSGSILAPILMHQVYNGAMLFLTLMAASSGGQTA